MRYHDKKSSNAINKFWTLIRVERNCEIVMLELVSRKVAHEATAKEKSITEMSNALLIFMNSCLLEFVIAFAPPSIVI